MKKRGFPQFPIEHSDIASFPMKKISAIALVIAALLSCACSRQEPAETGTKQTGNFNADTLQIKDSDTNKVKGQVVYVPIYSNIPYSEKKLIDVSAFMAIHNTDLGHSIRITKVLYFNNDGFLVKTFSKSEIVLGPMGATNFFIPKSDQSGTGANFLVEWIADQPVSEPLIESIMLSEPNMTFSILSKGKVVREMK